MITKIIMDRQNEIIKTFDDTNGFSTRTRFKLNGKKVRLLPNKEDSFMTSFPDLIDIGIMGKCANTENCKIGCYQGQKSKGQNMSIDDYTNLMKQCKSKVFQVALGGAGSPDEHESFEEILRITREYGIVPSYTTSGICFNDHTARLTKELCGAVAVSWYKQDCTIPAINGFIAAGCETNIHFVLGKSSIQEAIDMLIGNIVLPKINALIFLTHKPVGCGSKDEVLDMVRDVHLLNIFVKAMGCKMPFKIGFAPCIAPIFVKFKVDIDPTFFDTCEGSRYSCYIHNDMTMAPCSFDKQATHACDLRKMTIKQAWDSQQFEDFRKSLRVGCPSCYGNSMCMGGCPLFERKCK